MFCAGLARTPARERAGKGPSDVCRGCEAKILDPAGCLFANLQFDGQPVGCRQGGAKFCDTYGCVGCHEATSISVGVRHACCIPYEHELAEAPRRPEPISVSLALRIMATQWDNAPDKWWELLGGPLTEYFVCEHVQGVAVTRKSFKTMCKLGSPEQKVYNPATKRYDIDTKVAPKEPPRESRSGPHCGNHGCTHGSKNGPVVHTSRTTREEKRGRFKLRPAPADGDRRLLCTRCYNQARINEKNKKGEKGEKEKAAEEEKEAEEEKAAEKEKAAEDENFETPAKKAMKMTMSEAEALATSRRPKTCMQPEVNKDLSVSACVCLCLLVVVVVGFGIGA